MALFFPGKTISKIHGTAQVRDGIIYFAMYHPAAALHQQALRQTIEADMLKIPQILAKTGELPEEKGKPPPQQMNLF
jgi:DNA polymerase